MLVSLEVDVVQVRAEPEQKAQLLKAHIGVGQGSIP